VPSRAISVTSPVSAPAAVTTPEPQPDSTAATAGATAAPVTAATDTAPIASGISALFSPLPTTSLDSTSAALPATAGNEPHPASNATVTSSLSFSARDGDVSNSNTFNDNNNNNNNTTNSTHQNTINANANANHNNNNNINIITNNSINISPAGDNPASVNSTNRPFAATDFDIPASVNTVTPATIGLYRRSSFAVKVKPQELGELIEVDVENDSAVRHQLTYYVGRDMIVPKPDAPLLHRVFVRAYNLLVINSRDVASYYQIPTTELIEIGFRTVV
jgi:hypothetical protein